MLPMGGIWFINRLLLFLVPFLQNTAPSTDKHPEIGKCKPKKEQKKERDVNTFQPALLKVRGKLKKTKGKTYPATEELSEMENFTHTHD